MTTPTTSRTPNRVRASFADPRRSGRIPHWVILILLALLLWLPRGLALDRFVAVDERSWLTRSGNFYLALTQGDWHATFQRYHPGVTTMWLGMAGFLAAYPDYPTDAAGQISSMSEGIEDFLKSHAHPPMQMLAAGRSMVVLATVGLLLLAYGLAADLIGRGAALVGVLIFGFEPFGLGLTRMLHVDGLSSVLMAVSLLAYLRFRHPRLGRARRDLVLSGIAAGLAWLTKSPALFLLPFIGLVALVDLTMAWRRGAPLGKTIGHAARHLALWGAVAALVFVALWPAMWVQPLENLRAIFAAAEESAAEGHSKDVYFAGEVVAGDPGWYFYPVVYLWRTTPVTLLGLLWAGAAWIVARRRDEPAARGTVATNALWLALYALAFTVFMTFGSKKFPRYLLPTYLPLDLVAGVGWCALASWIAARLAQPAWRGGLLAGIVGGAVAAQAALALLHFPYYFTYYNPLLGGSRAAPATMMIGLGEGLDQAARYLNALPDAAQLTVASWYRGGSFNYIFEGHDLDLEAFYAADYAVLYAHQWQRGVPTEQMLDYFATLTPVHTVTLHGLDYAWVYDLRAAPPPAYFTDWAGAIRLVETQIAPQSARAGEQVVVRFRLYTLANLDRNLNVVARLVDAEGNEVGRSEGWPFGSPTSTWQPGEIYVDGHVFDLPADLAPGYLRVELGFYDAEARALIPPMVAGTTTPRGDLLAAGYVGVDTNGLQPPAFATPPTLGDEVRLLGAQLDATLLGTADLSRLALSPGESAELTLVWQPLRPPRHDYTTLLHLVGPDGAPVAQWDQPPLQGVAPPTIWCEGDVLVDRYALSVPADLPPGAYRLLTGLYDLTTLARLPVTRDGVPAGDTIWLADVWIE